MSSAVDRKDLQPGQWYEVTLNDCCIQGVLVGEFRDFVRDEEGDVDGYRFSFGTLEPGCDHFEFRGTGGPS